MNLGKINIDFDYDRFIDKIFKTKRRTLQFYI